MLGFPKWPKMSNFMPFDNSFKICMHVARLLLKVLKDYTGCLVQNIFIKRLIYGPFTIFPHTS